MGRTAVALRHVHFEDLSAFAAVLQAAGCADPLRRAARTMFAEWLSGMADL